MTGRWPRFAPGFWVLTWDQQYPLRASLRLPFPIPRCPLGLNFHDCFFSHRIMTETAPVPVGCVQNQSPLYRIAMNVAQLLSKLVLITDVAVIVALLPKNTRPQSLGEGQFQIVHSVR